MIVPCFSCECVFFFPLRFSRLFRFVDRISGQRESHMVVERSVPSNLEPRLLDVFKMRGRHCVLLEMHPLIFGGDTASALCSLLSFPCLIDAIPIGAAPFMLRF